MTLARATFGSTSATHDYHTRTPGSFGQTARGIRNATADAADMRDDDRPLARDAVDLGAAARGEDHRLRAPGGLEPREEVRAMTGKTMAETAAQPFMTPPMFSASGGTSPYSYQWYIDGYPVGTGTSYSDFYCGSNYNWWQSFTVSVTVTDAASAQDSDSRPVSIDYYQDYNNCNQDPYRLYELCPYEVDQR